MFRKALLGAALAGALGAAACESGPTPYQAAGDMQRGYTETRIEDNRYRIGFKGNALTNRETVENYMLYRAAELTLQTGFDTFTIVNRDTDKDSYVRETGGSFGSRMSYMYYVPRRGWVMAYDPYWGPSTYDEVTRYEAFAEITMGKGPKGSDPNSFDARDVSKNLSGLIARPAQ